VFPGSCFFEAAIAEFDSRPGPVRDAIVTRKGYWAASLVRAVREVQATGEVDPAVEAEQLAWGLNSILSAANGSHNIGRGPVVFERARRAIRERLERATIGTGA